MKKYKLDNTMTRTIAIFLVSMLILLFMKQATFLSSSFTINVIQLFFNRI